MCSLPHYTPLILKAYFEVASSDRRSLLDARFFSDDPKVCHEAFLPLFAVEAGIDIDGEDAKTARSLIADAYEANLRAGTAYAIKRALSTLVDVDVQEKEGYRFDLFFSTEDREITAELLNKATHISMRNKNVRSVLDGITLGYVVACNIQQKAGCAGESCGVAVPIDGYDTHILFAQHVYAGCVGEAIFLAEMEV